MNKKTIIISILTLLVVVIALVLFMTRPLSLHMEQIFPSKALMYVRLSHVSADMEQLSQSVFWKNISAIDVPKVLEHNMAAADDVKGVRQMRQEIGSFLKNPLTSKLLGKELALGVYAKPVSQKVQFLQSYDILFATRLGFSLQMAELFSSMAHQWSKDVTTKDEVYQGFKIVHVHFESRKLDLQYMRLRDVVLVSLSPSELLHQVVGIYKEGKLSLGGDSDFSKAHARAYANGHGIFYVNLQGFYDFLKKHTPKSQMSTLKTISDLSAGFKSYMVSFLPGDTSKMKVIMRYDPTLLNPRWRSIFACTASTNSSLKFTPHNAVFYQWSKCYDFPDLWAQMKEGIKASARLNQGAKLWKHRLEKKFKLNIHDNVLPLLGSQMGVYLNDVDIQGVFPYPRGVVFIKIKDRLAAEDLMKRFTKNPLSLISQEDYQQTLIRYMTLPFGANIDPGYAFVGDYLLLGSSKELLKSSIDAFNNSNQSLESVESVRQLNINSSTLSQGMVYLKMDDAAQRMEQILDWSNKTVSSQISMAMTYQQEAIGRDKELNEALLLKKEEIKLAKNKINELRQRIASPELSPEEKQNQQDIMDNLVSQFRLLQDDLQEYQQQRNKLWQTRIAYKNQSESDKLWLFNSDEIFMPLLKGMEGFHSIGMQLHMADQTSEAEIYIK